MKASQGNLRFSRSFREGVGIFLEIRNIAILLAVPVLIALTSRGVNRIEFQGVVGPLSRNHALRMMLWNVSVVVSLVALIRGCLSLNRLWSLEGGAPEKNGVAVLLGRASSLFLVFFLVVCIMGVAVMTATESFHLSGLLFLVGWCSSVLFWAVSLAVWLSLLTEGPAAAWLGGSLFLLAVVPGLFGKAAPSWLVPPLGQLIRTTTSGLFHPGLLLTVLFHTLAALGLAVVTLRLRRTSRRWP